jgi:hypothetical protein
MASGAAVAVRMYLYSADRNCGLRSARLSQISVSGFSDREQLIANRVFT